MVNKTSHKSRMHQRLSHVPKWRVGQLLIFCNIIPAHSIRNQCHFKSCMPRALQETKSNRIVIFVGFDGSTPYYTVKTGSSISSTNNAIRFESTFLYIRFSIRIRLNGKVSVMSLTSFIFSPLDFAFFSNFHITRIFFAAASTSASGTLLLPCPISNKTALKISGPISE